MLKKSIAILLLITMLLMMFPVITLAADVQQNLPINDGLETIDAVARIKSTVQSGSVSLTQDKVSGNYAVKVTANDEPGKEYVSYTLANSVSFAVYEYSQIKLWVKPGAGAKWIKFLTGTNVLIKSDINGDGIFTVGKDLISGKWNEVVLNLNKTSSYLIDTSNLTVQTNEYSTWSYDEITSIYTSTYSVDLSEMVNPQTELVNGEIQFKSIGSNRYNTEPTILTYKDFSKVDTSQYDFQQGNFNNTTSTAIGNIELSRSANYTTDLCNGGVSLSGGDYSGDTSYRAFDNNIGSNWTSSQIGTSVVGSAWIGYDFGTPKNIRRFTIKPLCVTSVKLQYWNASTWVSVGAFNLTEYTVNTINVTTDVFSSKWRLLANNVIGNERWYVYEIEMMEFAYQNSGSYTSPIMDISSVDSLASGSKINWDASLPSNTQINVETNLSFGGGNTWLGWQAATNGGTIAGITGNENLTNARLQYRATLSTTDVTKTPQLKNISLDITSQDIGNMTEIPDGKIAGISIDSSYVNASGPVNSLPIQRQYIAGVPTEISISGNGKLLYYTNPNDGNKLYLIDLTTGNNIKVSEYIAVDIKVNYDGSKIYFKDTNNVLYLCQDTTAVVIASSVGDFEMQSDGTVCYFRTDNSAIYYPNIAILTGQAVTYLDVARNINQIFYSNASSIYSLTSTPAGWKSSLITTGAKTIDGLWTTIDGSFVYFKTADGYFSYHLPSKALRKLDLSATTIVKVTDDNKLIVLDPNYKYQVYNPDTDSVKDIRPSDATNNIIDVDNSGDKMAYIATGGLSTYYINGAQRPERYLFSFDRRNTWYTYKDGVWIIVKNGERPVVSDFDMYGMTIDKVNSLDERDFESIYADGRQILNFDAAVYFASVDPYITPILKGITVTLKGGELGPAGELLERALYTNKQKDFSASTWRKIRKIYPIEIQPKEAEIYYFIIKDGIYKSYKNGQWIDNIDPNKLSNVEANWVDSINGQGITQIGMTAEELRAIPETALNSLLPATNISVIYAMKVNDLTTEGYSSLITIDYVQDLFISSNLVLKITMNDGTVKQYPGLTDTQVEDFMEWLNERQYNRGPIFYCIKVGNTNSFINYYSINYVDVDEM